jgi:hypothetical protein
VAGDRAEDSWTYAYDDLDRLLSAANTNTPALSQTFSYDLAGNLTANSSLGAYVYPAQGLASVQPHAVQSAGDWGFTYDANGNQTVRTTLGTPDRTITYDPDNRPALVAANGNSVTYLYGPDGERLKKRNGSDLTLYLGAGERDPAGGFTDSSVTKTPASCTFNTPMICFPAGRAEHPRITTRNHQASRQNATIIPGAASPLFATCKYRSGGDALREGQWHGEANSASPRSP